MASLAYASANRAAHQTVFIQLAFHMRGIYVRRVFDGNLSQIALFVNRIMGRVNTLESLLGNDCAITKVAPSEGVVARAVPGARSDHRFRCFHCVRCIRCRLGQRGAL